MEIGRQMSAQLVLLTATMLASCQSPQMVKLRPEPAFAVAVAAPRHVRRIGPVPSKGPDEISLGNVFTADLAIKRELGAVALPRRIRNVTITATHPDYFKRDIAVFLKGEGRRFEVVYWASLIEIEGHKQVCVPGSLAKHFPLPTEFVGPPEGGDLCMSAS